MSDIIDIEHLPPEIRSLKKSEQTACHMGDFSIAGLSLEEVEREMLSRSLNATNGNQSRAAALLGISRDTFRYRIRKFGLI